MKSLAVGKFVVVSSRPVSTSHRLTFPSAIAISVRPSALNLKGRAIELTPIEGMPPSSWRKTRPDATSHSLIELPSLPIEASNRPSGLKTI